MEKFTRMSFFVLLITWSCLLQFSLCQINYSSDEDKNQNLLFEEINNDIPEEDDLSLEIFSKLNESVVENCGTNGRIISLDIPTCTRHPCVFYAGQDVTLDYTFVTEIEFEKLDFILNLIELETGIVFPVKFTQGRGTVQANVENPSYTHVQLNTTIPDGKTWYMEIVRSFTAKEICAKFIVSIINNLPPTTTTESSSSPTTSEEPVSTTTSPMDDITSTISDVTSESSPSLPSSSTETATNSTSTSISISTTESIAFQCEGEGLFGDPFDCTIFHQCVRLIDGSFSDSIFNCPQYTVWCQEILRCEYSLSCPCDRGLFYY